MIAVGFAGLLKALAFSNNSVIFTIGSLCELLIYALLIHLLLSFPSGRLDSAVDRVLVAIAYFNTTVLQLASFLLTDPARAGCAECPANPVLITHSEAAAVINAALSQKPADMTITTHVCRGNFRSTWISSGGYEPVAETMLAGTNYDGYFLEYDSDRAGGFEPLRYLPNGNKVVVVGVITSKFGELESKEDIKRRLMEAAKFAPLEQLAVSPQCGFASTEEGNILSEEEQWAKLSLAVDVANEVWGK
jgi:hypothetical protein